MFDYFQKKKKKRIIFDFCKTDSPVVNKSILINTEDSTFLPIANKDVSNVSGFRF